MLLHNLKKEVRHLLQNSENPGLEAELLIAKALGLSRLQLLLKEDCILQESEIDTIHSITMRRIAGEPISYISGTKEFYGLNFTVSKDTLI
ncbi:MAG: peptide chain release factor N(5)-glutamine methyltransferase, partial [Desulfovibrio sp.]|nr:peptide chain release factor N(5)-glutamine methyltransferase [Desulfovibrio sp.]